MIFDRDPRRDPFEALDAIADLLAALVYRSQLVNAHTYRARLSPGARARFAAEDAEVYRQIVRCNIAIVEWIGVAEGQIAWLDQKMASLQRDIIRAADEGRLRYVQQRRKKDRLDAFVKRWKGAEHGSETPEEVQKPQGETT